MENTLFVTDLDGTLLNTSDSISDVSMEILNRLIQSGVKITYATARSLSSAEYVSGGLLLNPQIPVIVNNGVFIINHETGERLRSRFFEREQVQRLINTAREYKLSPFVYVIENGAERVSWIKGTENEAMRYYLYNRRTDKRFSPVFSYEELFANEMFYLTLMGDREDLSPFYDSFRNDNTYSCIFQQELYREEYWCEIMPCGSSKAEALTALKKLLCVERVVAFGDGINDMEMFMMADECYAVENAVEELKEISDGIIVSNDQDGVAKYIKARCDGK